MLYLIASDIHGSKGASELLVSLETKYNFKKINYLNYYSLSKRFIKILLDKMKIFLGKDRLYQTKRNIYKKYPNAFMLIIN